ncbi:MAG: hypothetical protein BGP06_10190 [Rhizobiales bacterium 65-9]|nr:adenosylcobinamide-GDP ribazoletransferase [Hyphomicrobiales bacterium]OJY33254.1 MAG: hypothetical protein BGP06_10190 [Rhizobiales bacterium 65-9]
MDQRLDPARPAQASLLAAVAQCVRFYSRLPLPALPGETQPYAPPGMAALPLALPFAALIIALPSCVVMSICDALGFPAEITAIVTVAAMLVTTGAFHEDGLADCADSFGGSTAPRRLEIMKDSRVGTFGAAALGLSLLLRVAALSALLETRPLFSVAALLLAIAALSRAAGLTPLALIPPARQDGASFDMGRPSRSGLAVCFLLCAAITGGAVIAISDWPASLAAALVLVAAAAGLATSWVAARKIGGQTGDVAGAAQQIAEMGCLLLPLAATFAQ